MVWVISLIVFIIVLAIFPRQTMGVIGFFALSGLIAYWYVQSEDQKRKELLNKIVVDANPSTKCDKNHPILVTVSNRSAKTVAKVSGKIGVYRKGYSSNLNNDSFRDDFSSDKILKPNFQYQLCVFLPKNLLSNSMTYVVKGKYVKFMNDE